MQDTSRRARRFPPLRAASRFSRVDLTPGPPASRRGSSEIFDHGSVVTGMDLFGERRGPEQARHPGVAFRIRLHGKGEVASVGIAFAINAVCRLLMVGSGIFSAASSANGAIPKPQSRNRFVSYRLFSFCSKAAERSNALRSPEPKRMKTGHLPKGPRGIAQSLVHRPGSCPRIRTERRRQTHERQETQDLTNGSRPANLVHEISSKENDLSC